MKKIIIGLIFFGLAFGSFPVQAGSGSPEDFFAVQIDKKISQREAQARLYADNKWRNLQCDGKSAADQVLFYSQNREDLIRRMVALNMDQSPAKVEYFLIKAYFDFVTHRQQLYACKNAH